jgi:hypothetical protein
MGREIFSRTLVTNNQSTRNYIKQDYNLYRGCYLLTSHRLQGLYVLYDMILHDVVSVSDNTGCFKKSFTTLKAYRNLYRGHTQRFELSKCSKTHRVLPRIVIRNCFDLFLDSFFTVPPPLPLRQSPVGHTAAITTITMHMTK